MKLLVLVMARNSQHVKRKIEELEAIGLPFKIICGERVEHPNVVYRKPIGKYDALNFGASLVPDDVEVVVMNDVDTIIHNIGTAIGMFSDKKTALVFSTELVKAGPQILFFRIMNPIRKIIPVAGSGELMLIRRGVLNEMLPIEPCKGEDTLLLFRVLEHGYKAVFSEECNAETERTKTPQKEELYKRKTVTGIYQALHYSKPPIIIRLFYFSLPFFSPMLLMTGRSGYYWMKGILLGYLDFLRGDRGGTWASDYME